MVTLVAVLAALALALLGAVIVQTRRASRLERELRSVARAVDGAAAAETAEADHGPSLQAAIEGMPIGVVLVDTEGRQVVANGVASSFLTGRHGDVVVARAIDELARATLDDGAGRDRELQIYGPPRRTLRVSAHPIGSEGGPGELGVNVLIVDMTEQERIDAIRRDFVANISHELRTPIGALALLAETLVDETDLETDRETGCEADRGADRAVVAQLAMRINGEAERLADTVGDLLQLSEIEHGSGDDFEPVGLQSVVASAADRVRAAAEQRNVALGVFLPACDLEVLGDPIQLGSAIYNLLDNAVKYIGADGGTVSVRAHRHDDRIELGVHDSGIGIPRRDLDRIFERFYRVDRGRSRASGGTGLGLSIVRHVVANHGGTIEVDSTEGEGTTFTVRLPALGPVGSGEAEPADDTFRP